MTIEPKHAQVGHLKPHCPVSRGFHQGNCLLVPAKAGSNTAATVQAFKSCMLYVALLKIPTMVQPDLLFNHLDGLCGGLGAKLDVRCPVFVALPMPELPIPALCVAFTLLLGQ